ncbi:MAG: methyltransferase [Tagaea sp.]|nr:methyltransferase [Tagaea sp.]
MTDETADLDVLLAAIPAAEGARALFVDAAMHPALAAWRGRIDCVQPWKPGADALVKQGLRVVSAPEGPYDAAFVRLQRQRERHLGDLARALAALRPGGKIAICGPNAMGGGRLAGDLAAMGVAGTASSKRKCRLVVAARPAGLDLSKWIALDAPRHVSAIGASSAPGLFAWDRLDPGSALLLDLMPKLSGKVADLGAGWGALARRLGGSIDAYEADARALDCLRANAPAANAIWHDVTAGLTGGPYDAIVSNLPFHDPRGENRALAEKFARVAKAALAPGGRFYAVANVHLPYEKTLDAVFGRVERLGERDGYKVFEAYAAATKEPSAPASAPGKSSTPKSRARSTGPANATLSMRERSKPKRA